MSTKKKPEKATTEKERQLMGLISGTRKPVTAYEKSLARDIKEIKARGQIVEIPSEFC